MKRSVVIALVSLMVTVTEAADNFNEEILKTLTRSARMAVPPANVACEIGGEPKSTKDGQTVYAPVTVGDYLATYIAWTSGPETAQHNRFVCEGDSILNCALEYGQHERPNQPAVQTILRFQYNKKKNTIIQESLHCVTIP